MTSPSEEESIFGVFEATVQHLNLVHRKIQQLEAARVQAEEQLFHSISSEHRAGNLSNDDLIDLYLALRDQLPLPFIKRWNAALPISAQAAWTRAPWRGRHEPNGPSEHSWIGSRPMGRESRVPRFGVAVVYVLYDEAGEPIYVGSTDQFRVRIGRHERGELPWVAYMALECADREAAYQTEDELLKTRMPPGNKRAGR
ncbi:GIY-YIG nuclease family protein [Micromonospora sp. NPDC049081]|uniref:GIY-YIG nuclease family protein n=1 Tax=Micromonospora sp. NPDC049081 TaxID=3155150 RepID=UPI0033E3705E